MPTADVNARLADKRAVHTEMETRLAKVQADRRRKEDEKARAEERIAVQLRRLAAEFGDVVTVLSVSQQWRSTYAITVLQWQGHGHGGKRIDVVDFSDRKGDELTDERIETTLRGKYAKAFEHQRHLGQKLGKAVMPTAEGVDLAAYRIEQPLAAALREVYGAAAADTLRKLLAAGPRGHLDDNRSRRGGIGDTITIKAARGIIRGEFEIRIDQKTSIVWSNGGLRIKGLIVPDTIALALSRDNVTRVRDIVEHPLIDGTIEVTSVQPVFKTDRLDVAMSTKGSEIPMPSDWL